ncbi:MAG: TIM barrel protein [Planctomycetaceae bacterium]
MKLSLSVRVAEAECKTRLNIEFGALVQLAAELGFEAMCLRASAGGVQTPISQLREMHRQVRQAGLCVSMVTADSDVPLNNERGPESLRDIGPSLDVAEAFECDLIRVCLKQDSDILHAKRSADRAAERGIRLAHQCHTTTLFEQVERALDVLQKIDSENFGLIYEPANLMLCGESYAADTLQRLQPHIMNVYVQNHVLAQDGEVELETWCLGPRRFDHWPVWEPGGVDFKQVFIGLKSIQYGGYFTIHHAQNTQTYDDAREYAAACADWFRSAVADDRPGS